MVCIVCFDVMVIIRFLKHDRCSREVIKQFNYDVDDFHWLKFIYMAVPAGEVKCAYGHPVTCAYMAAPHRPSQ